MSRDGVWYERKRMRMESLLLLAARLSAHAVSPVQTAGCDEDEGEVCWRPRRGAGVWAKREDCTFVAVVGVDPLTINARISTLGCSRAPDEEKAGSEA